MAGLGEAAVTVQGALEVIGVVPLRRPAVEAEPEDHHRAEGEQEERQPQAVAPRGG